MFLKQYNYKPRSGSQSSGTSGTAVTTSSSPPKEASKVADATSPISAAVAGRRRSSASGDKFAGLQGVKRSSQDDRKAAWTEQKQGTGILGGMWHNYTKGT